jgi:hypothetical protein
MSRKSFNDAEREEATKELRKLLKPGQKVFTILRHRASSGMFRVIDLVIAVPDIQTVYPPKPESEASYQGERDYSKPIKKKRGYTLRSIGYTAAKAMEDSWDSDRQGIKASGCGMDMGFNLVYNLGRALYPKGVRCTGDPDTCLSNDHVNSGPDRNRYDRRVIHRDSGYAFKHVWL